MAAKTVKAKCFSFFLIFFFTPDDGVEHRKLRNQFLIYFALPVLAATSIEREKANTRQEQRKVLDTLADRAEPC